MGASVRCPTSRASNRLAFITQQTDLLHYPGNMSVHPDDVSTGRSPHLHKREV
jgi:hypothetical protein